MLTRRWLQWIRIAPVASNYLSSRHSYRRRWFCSSIWRIIKNAVIVQDKQKKEFKAALGSVNVLMYFCKYYGLVSIDHIKHTKWITPAAVNQTLITMDTSCASRIELLVFKTFKYCRMSGTDIRRSARKKRSPINKKEYNMLIIFRDTDYISL